MRYHKSKVTVVDGPFTEAKELIAGYFIIEVKTLAEAVEWAKRAPFGVDEAESVGAGLVGEVVDDFVEVVVAGGGRAGECAEGGDAGDGDGGADGVVGGRLEVAVGELAAGFVHGAGGEGEDVADGDGLVEVVEAGGGGGVAECRRRRGSWCW